MSTGFQLQVSSYCFCNNRALFSPTLFNNGKFSYRKCKSISNFSSFRVRAVKEKTEEIKKNPSSAEDITKKYGLEAGLWKVLW